ncbi:MAG: hypothetical protein ABFD64_04025 [Armatimonadota bacterium]
MEFPQFEFPLSGDEEAQKIVSWKEEPGAGKKTPVRSYLRFGIDIDGTISRAPRHFQRLINALMAAGNVVYIITARDAGRRQETEEFLAALRIRYHWMIMKPIDWLGTIPDYKAQVVLEKDVHMLIDDEEENCWAVEIRTQALAVHMLPAPTVSEEFEVL